MNITIILVLDDDDLNTRLIRSITGFPSNNPHLHKEIKCGDTFFKLHLLHFAGIGEIGINLHGNALAFGTQPEIVIEGKCLVAVSHLNDSHADTGNHYLERVNFNGMPVNNVPGIDDTFTNCWIRMNEDPLIALGGIDGAGYEFIIKRFNSLNCDWLFETFGDFLKEK
jgi:hypothetical protein